MQKTSGESSDFIFAYRLSKIEYQRTILQFWVQGSDPVLKPYEPRSGTAFDNETKAEEQPKHVIDLSSVEIRNADVTSKDLDLDESLAAEDEFDDEECECILTE